MHVLRNYWLNLADKLQSKFPPNLVRNQKYNIFTFLPIVFYEQFKFFFNLYFLLVALSQFIPALKIGLFLSICHVSVDPHGIPRFHSNLLGSSCLSSLCYARPGTLRRL